MQIKDPLSVSFYFTIYTETYIYTYLCVGTVGVGVWIHGSTSGIDAENQ